MASSTPANSGGPRKASEPGLGQERADLEDAVALAGAGHRHLVDVGLGRGVGVDELGGVVVDAVVVAEHLDAVAGHGGLAVAGELERAGDAVVVDVGAGVDELEALGVSRCTSRRRG